MSDTTDKKKILKVSEEKTWSPVDWGEGCWPPQQQGWLPKTGGKTWGLWMKWFSFKTEQGFPGVHWLRIHLATQGTPFDPWSGKIPHALSNYWARTLEPKRCNHWNQPTQSLCPTMREATEVRSLHNATKSCPCSRQSEKAWVQHRRM